MTFSVVHVGEPRYRRNFTILFSVADFIPFLVAFIELELHRLIEIVAYPYLVGLDERKDFLIFKGVHIPDSQKLLVVSDQLSDVLAEQGKRRIRYYDVCLLQKFDALLAPEVPVPFELFDISIFTVTIIN